MFDSKWSRPHALGKVVAGGPVGSGGCNTLATDTATAVPELASLQPPIFPLSDPATGFAIGLHSEFLTAKAKGFRF
ncbi:MAG: hypothetical protein NTW21_24480 [Verrucomicrobia bacterium]|nr:hypothetical protein [Verrucomicrobiota bacterium]